MPNFMVNSRKEFEKFMDISWAPLPLFQVAMLMQKYKLIICLQSTKHACVMSQMTCSSLLRNKQVSG